MVGNLLTALFSTVGYCLLMNVPVKKIIPASVGGMLSWLLYLLLKDRVQSVFYLLVLVGAFAATYSEIAAKIAKTPATLFLLPALIPLVPGGSAYYAMLGLVQNRFADMRHYALLTGQIDTSDSCHGMIAPPTCFRFELFGRIGVRRTWNI